MDNIRREPRPPIGRVRPLVLLGGGLDSTALLVWLAREARCVVGDLIGVHFRYGQRAYIQEATANAYFCYKYGVALRTIDVDLRQIAMSAILDQALPPLPVTGNKLEGRNVIFVMMAATLAATLEYDALFLGYHHEPANAPFPDATEAAVEDMNRMLGTGYKSLVQVHTPFSHMTRFEIMQKGYELDPELLEKTHTCYADIPGGCGSCVHCEQKTVMMTALKTGMAPELPPNA